MSDISSESNLFSDAVSSLCDEYSKYTGIFPDALDKYDIKPGLRNRDGSGVVAGLTRICNVHGYLINEGERMPVPGELTYAGININDLVNGFMSENRFGYEETVWLLLFGHLPTAEQLSSFTALLGELRELPQNFVEDMMMKAPSNDIMNKLARSVLALYSYDDNPDSLRMDNVIRQCMLLIARMPVIAIDAYQVKKRHFDNETAFFHPIDKSLSTAQTILAQLRPDRSYTDEEAKLLDLCLVLHAEHGGGNNSTFSCRVLTSSGTDTYSAVAAAIGSLKGPRHGGANITVQRMLDYIKSQISDPKDDGQIRAVLEKIVRKEGFNGSGLIYGMGHAVYTVSDPRAVLIKEHVEPLAKSHGFSDDFCILDAVERLTPLVFADIKGYKKPMCANVDLYSGLVYRVLGIPPELFTPMFAVSRIAGWCAHRCEELYSCNKIIRPAYKFAAGEAQYVPLHKR